MPQTTAEKSHPCTTESTSRFPGGRHTHRGRAGTGNLASSRLTYRDVFAVSEFRALWSAQALSCAGDQFAQVAIAFVVYARTGSAFLTAAAYALTYLPPVIGGTVLSGLADLLPRQQMMITLDLTRAGLVALMALPGLPFAGLCALFFGTVLLGTPFSAARSALLPDVLPSDKYPLGSVIGEPHHPAEPDRRFPGRRRPGRVARAVPGPRPGLTVVQPVGRHPGVRGAAPAGPAAQRQPSLALGDHLGRRGRRVRQPGAAHPGALRLAGRLHRGARGPGRPVRARPRRRRARHRAAHGGHAGRHRDRRVRDRPAAAPVGPDAADGLAGHAVLRAADLQPDPPAAAGPDPAPGPGRSGRRLPAGGGRGVRHGAACPPGGSARSPSPRPACWPRRAWASSPAGRSRSGSARRERSPWPGSWACWPRRPWPPTGAAGTRS